MNETKLASLQKRIDELRLQVISGFYGDEVPQFRQGEPEHELEEVVTVEEVTAYVKTIVELRVELERTKKENDKLRATLEAELQASAGNEQIIQDLRTEMADADKHGQRRMTVGEREALSRFVMDKFAAKEGKK